MQPDFPAEPSAARTHCRTAVSCPAGTRRSCARAPRPAFRKPVRSDRCPCRAARARRSAECRTGWSAFLFRGAARRASHLRTGVSRLPRSRQLPPARAPVSAPQSSTRTRAAASCRLRHSAPPPVRRTRPRPRRTVHTAAQGVALCRKRSCTGPILQEGAAVQVSAPARPHLARHSRRRVLLRKSAAFSAPARRLSEPPQAALRHPSAR